MGPRNSTRAKSCRLTPLDNVHVVRYPRPGRSPRSQAEPPVPERAPSREGGRITDDGDSQDAPDAAAATARGGGPGAGAGAAGGGGGGDGSKHPRSSFATADSLYLQAKEVGGFVTTGSDR